MQKYFFLILVFCFLFSKELAASSSQALSSPIKKTNKTLAYIVSDFSIPFWQVLERGLQNSAKKLGYNIEVYSADNSTKHELELTMQAIQNKVAGIILSPITSSSAATVLKFTQKASIPVVIADIGTDSGEFVSYISSDNKSGAYGVGKVLAAQLAQKGWQKGTVGIIAISQKRSNGRNRTAGFMQAMKEANIKTIGIKQQATFLYQESYDYSVELIKQDSNLRAIWIQGSDRHQAVLDAIRDTGRQGEILLACFDAEPIFMDMIPQKVVAVTGMQQTYLMGEEAVNTMDAHLKGKTVDKNVQLPILTVSAENMAEKLAVIKRNVLGIESVQN